MPTPSDNVWIDRAFQNIKPEILAMKGYEAPPQGFVRAKLNQNENPYDLPEALKREILDRMASLSWGRYPENQPASLRNRLARYFEVSPDQLVLGHGSNQLLFLVFTAVTGRGDAVLLAPPTFSLVETIARLYQTQILRVPKDEAFRIPEAAFLEAAREARLVFLCSPDNPTGGEVSLDFLTAVLETTRGIVLWDEAYGEFWGKTAIPLVSRYPHLIVSRTLSKAFGLAGLRIGCLIAHPAMAAELMKANIPYCLDLFTILTAERLLEAPDWIGETVQRILSERTRLFDGLTKTPGVRPYPSRANFITFSVPQPRRVLRDLEARGVLIRDMTMYPRLEDALRVTVGRAEENDLFLDVLREVV